MVYRRFGDTFVVRLERGEEICECLGLMAAQENIGLAEISGLGAVDELLIGVYDVRAQRYASNPFVGSYEITALSGNLTLQDGAPHAHLHVTAGDIHGNAVGGHLLQATVSATAEIFVRVLPGQVERFHDEEMGIELMGI